MSREIYKNGDRGFNNVERENNVEHCVLITKPIDPPSAKYPALYSVIHGNNSAYNVVQDFSLHGFEKKNDDSLTIKYNTHYSGMSTNIRSYFALVNSTKDTRTDDKFVFVNAPEAGLLLNTKLQNFLPKQLCDETEYTIEGIDNSNIRNWKGYFEHLLPDENYVNYAVTNNGFQNEVLLNFCMTSESNYLKPNEVQYNTRTSAICTSSMSGTGMAMALYNDNYAASAITARRPEGYSNGTWYQNVAIDYTDEANLHRLKLGYTAIISGDNLDNFFNNDYAKPYQNIYAIGIKGSSVGGDDSSQKMITKFYICNNEQDSHFEKLQLMPKRLRENVYLIEDDEFKYIDVDHDEYINKSREYMIAKRDTDNKLIFYDYLNDKWTDDRKLTYLTAFDTQSEAQEQLNEYPVDGAFVTAVNRFALGQMYMLPSITSCTARYPYGNVPYETTYPVWYKIKTPYDEVSALIDETTYYAIMGSAYYKVYKGTYRTQDFEHYRPEDYDKVFINTYLSNIPDETFIIYRKNKTTDVITYYSGSKSIATADYNQNAWTNENDRNTNDIYNATVLCNSADNDNVRPTELLNYISGSLSSEYDIYRKDYEQKHIITRYDIKEWAVDARESLAACSAFSSMLQLYEPIDSDFRTTKENRYFTYEAAYPEDRLYMPIGSGARVIAFDYSLTRVPDIPMNDNTLRFKFRDLSFDPTNFEWKSDSSWAKVKYTDGNVWDYQHPIGNDDFSYEFDSKFAHNGNIKLGDAELVSANIHPTATNGMFAGCGALTRVASIDTSRCVNASYMFNNCTALTSIGELNFSSVSSMYHTFAFCQELTAIPDFTCTDNLKNVSMAFLYCSNARAGISAAYQQVSAYASEHTVPFYKCSKNSESNEMTIIPEGWK